MLRTIIRPDEAGVLRDRDGQAYNEEGQKIDAAGQIIVEVPPVQERIDRYDNHHIDRYGQADDPQQRQFGAQVARGRTLGDYNRPDEFYANRSAIRLPAFQRNDFELKPSYYTLVGQHPFHGLAHEHPMDHIERFEDLVTSMKFNGVSYDYLFCKLFPHSLGGEAAYWLKQLPTGCLTNWEDTKRAFLRNFYDDARSEDLRNNISQFTQRPTEAFKASWVRFRSYQRDCPHHGFSEVQLLGIFFRGIDWRYQMALDAASNGNFNTRSPEEAAVLIENLASSNSTKNADFERQKQAGNVDGKQMAEMKNKLDSVHNILVNKKSVHYAAEVETFEQEEDVNYIGGAGFQGQRFENQQNRGGYNPGYTSKPQHQQPQYQQPLQNNNFSRNYGSSSYQTPPAKTEQSRMKSMLEQLLEGQQKTTVDFNGKFDALYTDLNGKLEALNTHVKMLDVQVAQTAGSVKRQDEILPGNTDINPRYQCNAIMLRSGKEVLPVQKKNLSIEELIEMEEIEDDIAAGVPVSIDTPAVHRSIRDTNSGTPKNACIDRYDNQCIDRYRDTEKTSEGVRSIDPPAKVDATKLDPSKDSTKDKSKDSRIDRYDDQCIDRYTPPAVTPTSNKPSTSEERVYKPKVPYPRNPRKSKQEIEEARCKAMMDKVLIELPLVDAVKLSPPLKRYVKRMVANDLSPEEGALLTRDISAICVNETPQKRKGKQKKVSVSEQVSAMIQVRIAEKLPDPGSFVLDCSISTGRFPHSLCDLGSSVNMIPYSVALGLGMTDFTPTRTMLILADRSIRIPEGVLEDVPVKIGECMIPTDFVVLKYAEEPKDPLILGRPFLATAGAMIDVRKGRIGLNVGDLVMDFDMDKLRKRATIDGQSFSVETSIDITAGYVKELGPSEQASELEDWSGDHIFRTRLQDEVIPSKKLLEEDVFVMETEIAELNRRKSANSRTAGLVSIDTTACIDRYRYPRVVADLSETSGFREGLNAASSIDVVKQKASCPTLHAPREKQRYAPSKLKPSHIINKTFKGTKTVVQLTKPRDYRRALVSSFDDSAGKRSVPPIQRSHPGAIRHFLGRSHEPTAYKPPWMKRFSQRHLLPLSDPPDA